MLGSVREEVGGEIGMCQGLGCQAGGLAPHTWGRASVSIWQGGPSPDPCFRRYLRLAVDDRGRCGRPAHIFTECPLAGQAGRDPQLDSLASCGSYSGCVCVCVCACACVHICVSHMSHTQGELQSQMRPDRHPSFYIAPLFP